MLIKPRLERLVLESSWVATGWMQEWSLPNVLLPNHCRGIGKNLRSSQKTCFILIERNTCLLQVQETKHVVGGEASEWGEWKCGGSSEAEAPWVLTACLSTLALYSRGLTAFSGFAFSSSHVLNNLSFQCKYY